MRLFAISDIHTDYKENLEWVTAHAGREREHRGTTRRETRRRDDEDCGPVDGDDVTVLLVAGDVCDDVVQFRQTFEVLTGAYDHVFWVCGNHELWIRRGDRAKYVEGSLGKLAHLKSIADELGVKYRPERIGDVWVVPLWSWYHASWDTEPDVVGAIPIEKVMMDFHACHWTVEGVRAGGDDSLARLFDGMNAGSPEYVDAVERIREDRLGDRGVYVVSFSHFLPHQDLLPEKRFLYYPNLAKAVGSDYLGRRVFEEIRPDAHVYGHTHFTQDMVKDGIRFVQWPLGYPKEQRRRRHGGDGWGPLLLWDKTTGSSEARSTYWSDYYRSNPRRAHDVSPAPYVVRRRSSDGGGGKGATAKVGTSTITARFGALGV